MDLLSHWLRGSTWWRTGAYRIDSDTLLLKPDVRLFIKPIAKEGAVGRPPPAALNRFHRRQTPSCKAPVFTSECLIKASFYHFQCKWCTYVPVLRHHALNLSYYLYLVLTTTLPISQPFFFAVCGSVRVRTSPRVHYDAFCVLWLGSTVYI